MPNLDFAALVPRRDTFTDLDGKVHEFTNRTDFGAVETAKLSKAQAAIERSLAAIQEDFGDEKAAVQFETAVNDIMALVLPSVARERLAAWTLGQKNAIIAFWNTQQDTPAGEAPAGQLAPA